MLQRVVALSPRIGRISRSSDDDPRWRAFRSALVGLIHASCCGGGAGGTLVARPMAIANLHRFARMGVAAWSATVHPSRPRLPVRSGDYTLPDVTIVAPDSPPRAHVDLHVVGGRIAGITPTGEGREGRRYLVEAVRGHVVSPALTDMHSHMPPANALNLTPVFMLLNLRHGVVRTRDAGDLDGTGTPKALGLVLSGALPGPEIHYAYCFITSGAARWSNSLAFDHPDQAPSIIAQLARLGASWVKAYENLDPPRLRALVDAAERGGMGVLGHVPTKLSIEEAAIPDSQHLWGVAPPKSLRQDHLLNRIIDWDAVTPTRLDAVVAACVSQSFALTPTLTSHFNLQRLANYEAERDSDDVRLLPSLYREVVWHPTHGLPTYRHISADDFDRSRRALDLKLDLVRKLARSGVPLRLGTDVQQPFVVPGAALHKEIELFEQAGVSRSQAWSWASRGAAKTLGLSDAGKIESGARADLLTSPVSPLEPGWRPLQASSVVVGGKLVLSQDLDAAIASELARFEGVFARYVARWLAQFTLNRIAKNFIN